MSPSEFQQFYEERLPVSLKGSEFLERYGEHIDAATEVDPETTYPVRQATLHPIFENFRVRTFRQALLSDDSEMAKTMGELMFQVCPPLLPHLLLHDFLSALQNGVLCIARRVPHPEAGLHSLASAF